jgi:hypothetical protein
METRTLAVLLFAVLLVALSVYAAVAETGVNSARGNSLNIGDVSATAMQAHGVPHRLAAGVNDETEYANDKESGQNRDFDGELGLQMSRGGASTSTTGSFRLSAGTGGDKEEEMEL